MIDVNSTPIDPNVLTRYYVPTKDKDLDQKISKLGRGTRVFQGAEFSFAYVADPKKSILGQGFLEDPNFCIGTTSFFYGKDKEPYTFVAYGPSQRVLNEILTETDKKYHEDIVDWHTSKKLYYLSEKKNTDPNASVNAKKVLAQGIETLIDGFEKRREVTGKPAPKIFKDKDKKIATEALQNIGKLRREINHINPLAFKSAKTKDVVNKSIYTYLKPAEILTQRLAITGVSVPQLAAAVAFDLSTVYHHIKGTRDVDRNAALRYAQFFNCDPADILFPPIKIPLTGRTDLIKKDCQVDIDYTKSENVLCPRDFYSNARDIKAIKITSPSSVYNDHVAYYYYSNKKETDCENKICFIGVKEKGFMDEPYTNYYLGIYENYRGETKILNPDPYRNREVILQNPEIEFITPIIGMVNVERVKFSPIVDVAVKKISENEKLQKLEKELEIAEDHWWIENQKLSGKQSTSRSKARELDKMFSSLKQKRLEYQQLKRKLTEKEFTKEDADDLEQRMKKLFEDTFEEDKKLA